MAVTAAFALSSMRATARSGLSQIGPALIEDAGRLRGLLQSDAGLESLVGAVAIQSFERDDSLRHSAAGPRC
jgi:hypothetical protein